MGRPKSERPTGRYKKKKPPQLGDILNTSTNQPNCLGKIAAQLVLLPNCPFLPDVLAGLSLESIALWACECRSLAQPSWLWLAPTTDSSPFLLPHFSGSAARNLSLLSSVHRKNTIYCRLIQKSHCGAALHKTLVFIDAFGLKHIWWLTHKDSFATIMMTPTRLSVQRTMTCPFHPVLNISEVEFLYGSENSRDFMLFSWYFFFFDSSRLRP